MYRGYCAHSSLVGVCSSGVCLIIRTAITNAWQNCPLCTGGDRRCRLQCVRADAPRSPFVSAVPLSVQGLQGSMELSASNTPVGKAQFPLFHSSAVQTRLLRRAGAHIHRRCERERAAAYAAMAATLAALHSVDPAAVGLQRFGRERGYCRRQARLLLHASQRLCSCHHTLPPHSHPAASRPPEVAGNLQPG